MLDPIATTNRASGKTFIIHAEMLVRHNTALAPLSVHYVQADCINLPRRPQVDAKNPLVRLSNPVQVPKAAVPRLAEIRDAAAMANICPHIVGYEHENEESLAKDLRFFYNYGVRTVLLVKGDPFPPKLTTLQMLEIAKGIRDEYPLELAVVGQLPKREDDIKRELEYLGRKIEAGASIVLTQPVHSLRKFERYCKLLEGSGLHQSVSFRPGVALWSGAGNAWFWSRLLAGVNVPWWDLLRMRSASNLEEAGVEIAKEKIKAIVDAGIFGGCLIFPFGKRNYTRIGQLALYARRRMSPD